MKTPKSFSSIFIVVLIFSLIMALAGGLFAVVERVFPCAVADFKRDLMFIGAEKELSEYTLGDEAVSYSFEELLRDRRTVYNNSLVLISSAHPIGDALDFSSICEYKDSDVFFDYCAHASYSELSSYISESFGTKLYVSSAYRNASEQEALYKEQGADTAQKPGESEHQSGLALDVYVSGFSGASFFKTEVGKYVNMYCHRYGFIIRYPSDAKEITGIDFEPWHIRYVGSPHADIISMNGITLEEYLDMLSPGIYYSYGDYIMVKISGESSVSVPESYESLVISPDNCGNFILTFKLGSN